MPAKASLFNNKGEIIYDFGTGSRNECFFSPHGNIVCLGDNDVKLKFMIEFDHE